jgi:two-component system sensor histidine kinase BaeS
MMHTLRARLILSHILPLLVIVALIGIALNYVLETRFLLTNLAGELTGKAILVAELATDKPELWDQPAQAQEFAERVSSQVNARVMLLDTDGSLLASTDQADLEFLGQVIDDLPDLEDVLAGEVIVGTQYSRYLLADVVDVQVPAWGPDQQVIGVVRLTHRLENIYEQVLVLRYLIVGVLAFGLALGLGVSWFFAVSLGRYLRQVTQAVHGIAGNQDIELLPVQGPDEIKTLLSAVNTMSERLQNLEKVRRRLLANLVHELGRPLGALLSAIQALQRGAHQEKAFLDEILQGMQDEVGRLRRLLNDLMRMYDQVLGAVELSPRLMPLSEWLRGVLPTWREVALSKGLQWEVGIPDNLPSLTFDPDRLAQALGNLTSNAIKYTPKNGTVTVDAGVEETRVWIRVRDTGPGIPIQEQAEIFEPFYRGTSNRRFPQGMGLGLSIARDQVEAHGGHIEVRSTPGEGSAFTIWLKYQVARE